MEKISNLTIGGKSWRITGKRNFVHIHFTEKRVMHMDKYELHNLSLMDKVELLLG
jgi:hypothetical protein